MLTVDWFRHHGACAGGLRWFAAHYPEGVGAETAPAFAEILVTTNAGWAVWFVGRHVSRWAEYERQVAPLWAEYERQRDPLLRDFVIRAVAATGRDGG